MKILCQSNILNKALQNIQKPLNNNPQNHSLKGVYIKAANDLLEIKSSDGDFLAIVEIPIKVIEAGEVLVSGDFLTSVFKGIRSEELEIYTKDDDNMLYIESNILEYSLYTMPIAEYPVIKTIKQEIPNFTMNSNILKDLISKTGFACAKDSTKPIFKGIYFDIKKSILNCVATDSHRLAIKSYELPEKIEDISLLIPNEFLLEVTKHIDDESIVQFYLAKGKIAVQINNLYMESSIMEGTFPDYTKIIPKDFNGKIVFNIGEMVAAIENASKFAKDKKYINCQVVENEFIIVVNNPELGKAKEIIGCKNNGMNINITFNAEYIVQVLKKFDNNEGNLFINSNTSPCSIKQHGDDSYNYIVSPMRVNN